MMMNNTNNQLRVSRWLSILMGLVISCYMTTSYAKLSAMTSQTIQGTSPRLNTTLEKTIQANENFGLFGLSDNEGSYFTQADIEARLPSHANKPVDIIKLFKPVLNTLSVTDAIDSDGDSIASLEEKTTGSLILKWYIAHTDIELSNEQINQTFYQLATADIVPELRVSGAITLKTSYGDPNQQDYPDASIGITQTPKRTFHVGSFDPAMAVRFARPDMKNSQGSYAGPKSMWSTNYGFIPQSTTDYHLNFPTMGAHGLYFDLILTSGVDATTLVWPGAGAEPLTIGGVTVAVSVINSGTVKVTLSGPKASTTNYGATADIFNGPAQFIIEGKSDNTVKVSYGFELKKWFINRGKQVMSTLAQQKAWCNSLNGTNYYLPSIIDLTNAPEDDWEERYTNTRQIGGGLFSEWGYMFNYINAGFVGNNSKLDWYWTSDGIGLDVSAAKGTVGDNFGGLNFGICASGY